MHVRLSVADTPDNEPDRFYFISGLVGDWSTRAHNNYTQSLVVSSIKGSRYEKKHHRAKELAEKYICLLDPSFTYTSIQFSRCMCAPKRIDGNNLGDSIIVSIGDYEG
jgi:hypothetical protein